ncbi:chromosome partitioning protein, ParB family [Octadecabacter temperatus]|uniref:Chromosome-partitioning protein ParB n=1 Tax=Octadecabacter temperatus TaxID=1458307 RepID=A0A0K0YA05_9RHOB|nr:ParB/RepB/Spo0J family partition protein [Octadecabacter temperatus]AKS47717.1 Chromosome-partitioning protein ParB [Octadecabacter temperatus]SIO39467.1 chromosome partitioning protein, ParB family [Octadecabacter temperatus]
MSTPKTPNRGLGRGLSALMSDVNGPTAGVKEVPSHTERTLPVDQIYPNPDQPRRTFDDQAMSDLTASIAEKGIIQPLIVRRKASKNGEYEIVAGERRWRAAQRAKLHEVPVIIRDFTDVEVLEVAIIENIQRSDLNAIDEAAGYKQLMEKFGRTQEEMGKALSKSRSHIANSVRLLTLPDTVQTLLQDGMLSAGHARTLVGHPDADSLAVQIVKNRLSVRDAEKLSKASKATPKRAIRAKTVSKDADTVQIEKDLAAQLGMKVSINHTEGKETGQVTLSYRDLEQLDDLLKLLSGG